MKGKKLENGFSILFSKMDMSDVGFFFSHLRAEMWYNGSYVCPEEPQGGQKCCLRNHLFIPPG